MLFVESGYSWLYDETEQQLRAALPHVANTGLPLSCTRRTSRPDRFGDRGLRGCGLDLFKTFLASRPEEAETGGDSKMMSLCREYSFRLPHCASLRESGASAIARRATEGLPVSVEPALTICVI